MKYKCDNFGEKCDEGSMVFAADANVCIYCFAEDPEFYGMDIEIDGDDE